MISPTTVLAAATFFINPMNRHFVSKWVLQPTAHTAAKVERVVTKPFRKEHHAVQ